MSDYTEAQRATQLDHWLNDESAPLDALPHAERATAHALRRSAEAMTPDVAFAAHLQQRLNALPMPAQAAAPEPRAAAWWRRFVPQMGQLAWAAIFALLLIGFAIALRSLSNDSVPSDVPEQRLTVQPTSNSDLSQLPILDRPLLAAQEISLDSWSPDRRWLTYWFNESSENDSLMLGFVDAESGEQCAQPEVVQPPDVDAHVKWHDDTAFAIVGDEAFQGMPCAPFQMVAGGRFSVPDVKRSPTGRFEAVTTQSPPTNQRIDYSVIIRETKSRQVITEVTWERSIHNMEVILGEEGGWLTDDLYLVGKTLNAGIAYLSVPDGTLKNVMADFFHMPQLAPQSVAFVIGRADASSEQFHILAQRGAEPPTGPRPLLLYHSESDSVEELPYYTGWSPFPENGDSYGLSEDGQWLMVGMAELEAAPDFVRVDSLIRPVDTIDGTALKVGDGWTHDTFSSAAQQSASHNGDQVTIYAATAGQIVGQWGGEEAYRINGPMLWSPDGKQLAVRDFRVIGREDRVHLINVPMLVEPQSTPRPTPISTVPTTLLSLADATLIAEGEDLMVEGWSSESWSPDGRYLVYREITAADVQDNPQLPAGDWYLYDSQMPDRPCTQVVDHRQSRPHFWLNDNEILYVNDNGDVVSWPPCSDEQTPLTEVFPEIPLDILTASPDRSRFLYLGATSYWLFGPDTYQVTRVEGLQSDDIWDRSDDPPALRFTSTADRASWSPDGAYLSLTFDRSGDTVVVDATTGNVIHRVEGRSLAEDKAGPGEPIWLAAREFLIPEWTAETPLIVSEQEGEWREITLTERIVPGMTVAEQPVAHWHTRAFREAENGATHLILVGKDQAGQIMPYPLLYHAESGEVEELWFSVHQGLPSILESTFSDDGRYLVGKFSWASGGIEPEYWGRPLDPVGAPTTRLPINRGTPFRLSADGRRTLSFTETGMVVIDNIIGQVTHRLDVPGVDAWWTPDGDQLVLEYSTATENTGSRLLLLPLLAGPATPLPSPEPYGALSAGTYSCNTDLNLSWITPAGWFVRGSQIYNYEEQADPAFRPTPDHLRIDIGMEETKGRSLEEVVEAGRRSAAQGPPPMSLTANEPITIAGMTGYRYDGIVENEPVFSARFILLDAGEGRLLSLAIRRADSRHMDEAMAMLETLTQGPCTPADVGYTPCPPSGTGDGACLPNLSALRWQPLSDGRGDLLADLRYPIVAIDPTDPRGKMIVTVNKDEERGRFATGLLDGVNSLWLADEQYDPATPPVYSTASVRGTLWANDRGDLFFHDGVRRQLPAPVSLYSPRWGADGMAFATGDDSYLWRGRAEAGEWEAVVVQGEQTPIDLGIYFAVANDGGYALSVQSRGMWRIPATMGAAAVPLPAPAVTVIRDGEGALPPRQLGQSDYWLIDYPIAEGANGDGPVGRGFVVDATTGRTLTAADFALPSDAEALQYRASPDGGQWLAIEFTSVSAGGAMLYIAPSDELAAGKLFEGKRLEGWDLTSYHLILRDELTDALVAVDLLFEPQRVVPDIELADADELLAVGERFVVTTSKSSPNALLLFELDAGGPTEVTSLPLSDEIASIESAAVLTRSFDTLYLGVTLDDGRHGLVRWPLE